MFLLHVSLQFIFHHLSIAHLAGHSHFVLVRCDHVLVEEVPGQVPGDVRALVTPMNFWTFLNSLWSLEHLSPFLRQSSWDASLSLLANCFPHVEQWNFSMWTLAWARLSTIHSSCLARSGTRGISYFMPLIDWLLYKSPLWASEMRRVSKVSDITAISVYLRPAATEVCCYSISWFSVSYLCDLQSNSMILQIFFTKMSISQPRKVQIPKFWCPKSLINLSLQVSFSLLGPKNA